MTLPSPLISEKATNYNCLIKQPSNKKLSPSRAISNSTQIPTTEWDNPDINDTTTDTREQKKDPEQTYMLSPKKRMEEHDRTPCG